MVHTANRPQPDRPPVRHRLTLVVAVIGATAMVSSCGLVSTQTLDPAPTSADPAPAVDCAGTFSFSNGTPRPPWGYEYEVEFGGDGVSVTWRVSHYDGAPEWTADVTPEAAALTDVCSALEELGTDARMVGGANVTWETATTSGYNTDPQQFAPALEAVRQMVGERELDELKQRYERWRERELPS
jgi:hypothetical protein